MPSQFAVDGFQFLRLVLLVAVVVVHDTPV
jgi:hypothetical protein